MRMSRLIVHPDVSDPARANDVLHCLKAAVEQIDLLAADRQPRAADDPGTPFAGFGHDRAIGIIDQASQGLAQSRRSRFLAASIVEADVGVGARPRRSSGARAAKRDRSDAWNGDQRRRQTREDRVRHVGNKLALRRPRPGLRSRRDTNPRGLSDRPGAVITRPLAPAPPVR